MQKKFFRMAVLASTVFVASQSFNAETAHAGSVVDFGAFTTQHSEKFDSLLEKYVPESIRDQIQNKSESSEERSTSKGDSSIEDDKWNIDSLLSRSNFRRLR